MTIVSIAKLDDFIAELRECVYRINLPVRWHEVRAAEQKEAISFEVGAWATVLVGNEAEADSYLAECLIPCGRDSKAGNDGTANAAKAKAKLAEACDDMNLKLRPGKWEVY